MTALASPYPAPGGWQRLRRQLRARRVLVLALVASLVVHVVASFFADDVDEPPESAPLTATLTEIPPPPLPQATPAPAVPTKPAATKPRRSAPRSTAPKSPVAVAAEPSPSPPVEVAPSAAAEAPAPIIDAPAEEPLQPLPAIEAPAPGATLPPRIDLAYRVFLGTQGFEIGQAVYRFEHADDRYRISTVGQAKGLAALLMRGQGRLESRGDITTRGLRPLEFSVDRFNRKGHESARFDWNAGTVTLHEDKVEPIELPAFDPLTLMWQFYFTPPDVAMQTFSVATTKRVARYTIVREATDSIPWRGGHVDAERWVRVSDDGKAEAIVWVAPSLRWLPVKMRVSHTQRGTVEALLDGIRVDDAGTTRGRDDYAFSLDAPAAVPASPSMDERTGLAPTTPAATFPAMTGQ